MGVYSAGYLQHLVAAGCPISTPAEAVRTGEFSLDQIAAHAAKLRDVHVEQRFGTALALVEQCARAHSGDPAELYAVARLIMSPLPHGLPDHGKAKRALDNCLADLSADERVVVIKQNQLYSTSLGCGDVDVFAIRAGKNGLTFCGYEVKGSKHHRNDGFKQVRKWLSCMYREFEIPQDRLEGYLWEQIKRDRHQVTRVSYKDIV